MKKTIIEKLTTGVFLILTAILGHANESKIDNYSQKCFDELEFVVSYIENNLPAYQFNVTAENSEEYSLLKKQLFDRSKQINNRTMCYKILVAYVEYFKDNHTKISMDYVSVDDSNQESLIQFYQSDDYKATEFHQLSKEDYNQYPLDDIRGIYQTASGAYKLAVIKSKSALHDYIGVVIESKTPLWKKGQIKIELKSKKEGGYQALVSMKNHFVQFYNHFPLNDGILGDNWFKTTVKNKVNPALNLNTELEIKQLNNNTVYLRVPSFSGYQTAEIQALYAKADPIIRQNENLIIDVRNNGGGSDSNALPLIKYLYTNPIQGDKVSLYVTADNIKAWEKRLKQFKLDKENFSPETIQKIEDLIETMKAANIDTFIDVSQGNTIKLDKVLNYPKKIAIIQNRECASSCESLLYWGMQSEKTTLVGENSGGYIGYGEIQQMKTPYYGFDFQSSMSLYETRRKYETIGIPAMVMFDYKTDWVKQAQEFLNN